MVGQMWKLNFGTFSPQLKRISILRILSYIFFTQSIIKWWPNLNIGKGLRSKSAFSNMSHDWANASFNCHHPVYVPYRTCWLSVRMYLYPGKKLFMQHFFISTCEYFHALFSDASKLYIHHLGFLLLSLASLYLTGNIWPWIMRSVLAKKGLNFYSCMMLFLDDLLYSWMTVVSGCGADLNKGFEIKTCPFK